VDEAGRPTWVDPDGATWFIAATKTRVRDKMKYEERWLALEDAVYVIGQGHPHGGPQGAPAVGSSTHGEPFFVSSLPEAELVATYARSAMFWFNLSMACVLVLTLVGAGASGYFGADDYIAASLVPLVLLILVGLVQQWLDLTFLTERVEDAWSAVEEEIRLARGALELQDASGNVMAALGPDLRYAYSRLVQRREHWNLSSSRRYMEQLEELAEGVRLRSEVPSAFVDAVQQHRAAMADCTQHLEVSIGHLQARTRSFPDGVIALLRQSEACVRSTGT
jgi:hypothetical protein